MPVLSGWYNACFRVVAGATATLTITLPMVLFPAVSMAESIVAPLDPCAGWVSTLHNGYKIQNNTSETLLLKDMKQNRGLCVWGDRPPTRIAPGEEVEFSVGMWGGQQFDDYTDWWDSARVVYVAKTDVTSEIQFDANVGFRREPSFLSTKFSFIDDKSSCTTLGQPFADCGVQPSHGRKTQTVFTLDIL